MRGIADLVTEMIFPELEAMCLKPAYQRQQQEMGPWDCRSGSLGIHLTFMLTFDQVALTQSQQEG